MSAHRLRHLPHTRATGHVVSMCVAAVVLLVVVSTGGVAHAFFADFFEKNASGNATYEAMVIHPTAVYDAVGQRTVVAYQGQNLDPYVITYDHVARAWSEPIQIGDSQLANDSHGGPSACIDALGRVHVFFGAHNGVIQHAVDGIWGVSGWNTSDLVNDAGVAVNGTYPQPIVSEDGTITVYYRSGATSTFGQWVSIVSTDSATTWAQGDPILVNAPPGGVSTGSSYYMNLDLGEGSLHAAMVRTDYAITGDLSDRHHVFYARMDTADGQWYNAAGEPLVLPLDPSSLETSCAVFLDSDARTNQCVVRELEDGSPGILYVTRPEEETATVTWMFASRSEAGSWTLSPVATTDNLFDAGDFESMPDGSIEAFIVTGGVPDDQGVPGDPMASRGGDVVRMRSVDGGVTWETVETVIASDDAAHRYNDPQLLRGTRDAAARLVFCEWDNDFSNYVHKVFLWGSDGSGRSRYLQREFNPEITRLAGTDRLKTAIEVSKSGYPSGGGTVLLASKSTFPDALCGAPLAQYYRAPVLLVDKDSLDTSVAAEIARLVGRDSKVKKRVIILGSEASVSATVTAQVRQALSGVSGVTYQRLGGADRFETSAKIAYEVARLRGSTGTAVVATGLQFADALAVSPYAARKGYPILLVRPETMPSVIATTLMDLETSATVIVGGGPAVSAEVATKLMALTGSVPVRLEGSDRYATARSIAEYAIADGTLDMERFVLCSGENFPDAIVGGPLAARIDGALVLTRKGSLPESSITLLQTKAWNVLDAYILGSDAAVEPVVENALQSILQERQD